MIELIQKIRRDVSEGYTEEGIKKAIILAKKNGYKSQLNYLRLLSSQLNQHRREYLGSMTKDKTVPNKIDLALLSVVDSILRINKPISKNKKQEQFIGKIWYLNNDQKYGFIKSSEFTNEIFFHYSSVNGNKQPRITQKVRYELDKNLKGWYSPSVELIVRTKKPRDPKKPISLSKKQKNRELRRQLLENDIRHFFRKVEDFTIKILNRFYR